MSHAVGVVGHVDRAEMVERLVGVVKPDIVSIDDGVLGCEGNHRRVWAALASDYSCASWCVVLEDDAVPVDDFAVQLEAALRVAPAPVVSLYLGRKRPGYAQHPIAALVEAHVDAHWIVANRLLHAVGVAIRTPLVPAMLACVGRPHVHRLPIDEAITHWAVSQNIRVAYTWPSLVDHADAPTVINAHADGAPRAPGRVAWRAAGRSSWCSSVATLRLPR